MTHFGTTSRSRAVFARGARAFATDRLEAQSIRPASLTLSDLAAWRALCRSHPQFGHPLLQPDFAQAVGRVRDDARVAIWRRQGRAVGFLAYHRQASGVCRPIGAPFSDFHALISDGSFKAEEALTVARLPAFRFSSLIDPHGVFEDAAAERKTTCAIRVSGDARDVLSEIEGRHPKLIKNYRRLERKLEREIGPLRLVVPDRSAEAFSSLMGWKEEQFVRTGVHNVLRTPWVTSLFQDLFDASRSAAPGVMVSLYAGDDLVAGHFGVRCGAAYQPWITSVNPKFRAWSPGHILLLRAVEAMPDIGLQHYDLGASDAAYKELYAQPVQDVFEGVAVGRTFAGGRVKLLEKAWNGAGEPGRRVQRRLEVVFASEQSFIGKANGLARAVLDAGRRGRARAASLIATVSTAALEPLYALTDLAVAVA